MNTLESLAGPENHKAEGLFKKFQQHLGRTFNWTPSQVHRKLKIKSDKNFQSKEKLLRGTENFLEEIAFKSNLRNSVNFIACFETKNLVAKNPDGQDQLEDFLVDQYEDAFIWGVGRNYDEPENRNTLRNYSYKYIEIPDLNFGADKINPITALCPMDDLICVLLFEENNGITTMYNKTYLKTKTQRGQKYITPIKAYEALFKTTKTTDKNKENVDPQRPGPSGFSSSQTSSFSSETTIRIASSVNSDESVPSQTGSSHPDPSPNQTVFPNPDLPEEEASEEEEDEDDSDDEGDKSIVFRPNYAEVTSHGETTKVVIGSKKVYNPLISKVRFQ